MEKTISFLKLIYWFLFVLGVCVLLIKISTEYETGEYFSATNLYSSLILVFLIWAVITSMFGLTLGILSTIQAKKDIHKSEKAKRLILKSIIGIFASFLLWFVINFISVFFFGVGESPSYISSWRCPKEARYVVDSKNYQLVHSCSSKPTTLDNQKATIVSLMLGPGQDCLLGCIYNDYYALVVGKEIIDIPREPNTHNMLNVRYGKWCSLDVRDDKKLKPLFTSNGQEYYWTYEFDNYNAKNIVLKKLRRNKYFTEDGRQHDCIFNGKLVITSVSESGYAISADYSNLEVSGSSIKVEIPTPTEGILEY